MPRVSRKADQNVLVCELSADELDMERRLGAAERVVLASIEKGLGSNPNPKNLSCLAGALTRLRTEIRLRYKLKAKVQLSQQADADNPEEARGIAASFLASLPVDDRIAVLEGAYPDDTLMAWLAGMDERRLKVIYTRVRELRHGDGSPVATEPPPVLPIQVSLTGGQETQ